METWMYGLDVDTWSEWLLVFI